MAPPDLRRPAVVLVVEDEPVQRLALSDLVEEGGFEVLEAWDADSALAILETRTDVRLVVTDIDVPGSMDGVRLAAAVRDRWPPLEVVLISAGPSPDVSTLPARVEFQPKPIQVQRILSALHRLAPS